MRNTYVICYDIADPKRWRKVYKTLMGVGDPVQYSVFRCQLSGKERILMLEKLVPAMNQAEDRVMLINLGPAGRDRASEDRIECWGKPLQELPPRGPIIV
jgi:CRISPR-associated protein Cas2